MARRVSVPSFVAQKGTRRLVCLTAYDVITAGILDDAGVDLILVGDSLGNVVLGLETTLPVTLDQMVSHAAAVMRAVALGTLLTAVVQGTLVGLSFAFTGLPSPVVFGVLCGIARYPATSRDRNL